MKPLGNTKNMRNRLIKKMFCLDLKSPKEIGDELGITGTRVMQILKGALFYREIEERNKARSAVKAFRRNERAKERYKTDPIYRNKIKERSLNRYYKLK